MESENLDQLYAHYLPYGSTLLLDHPSSKKDSLALLLIILIESWQSKVLMYGMGVGMRFEGSTLNVFYLNFRIVNRIAVLH